MGEKDWEGHFGHLLCDAVLAAQVGSSTMPQKRNPHKSERICGLARIVRAQLDPALETVSLEHERDLTNSSTERISLPTAVCLTHYILTEMLKILRVLHVDEDAVRRNLHAGGGAQVAERIMMALADRLGRQVRRLPPPFSSATAAASHLRRPSPPSSDAGGPRDPPAAHVRAGLRGCRARGRAHHGRARRRAPRRAP